MPVETSATLQQAVEKSSADMQDARLAHSVLPVEEVHGSKSNSDKTCSDGKSEEAQTPGQTHNKPTGRVPNLSVDVQNADSNAEPNDKASGKHAPQQSQILGWLGQAEGRSAAKGDAYVVKAKVVDREAIRRCVCVHVCMPVCMYVCITGAFMHMGE